MTKKCSALQSVSDQFSRMKNETFWVLWEPIYSRKMDQSRRDSRVVNQYLLALISTIYLVSRNDASEPSHARMVQWYGWLANRSGHPSPGYAKEGTEVFCFHKKSRERFSVSLDQLIRPCYHIRWNRQADLLGSLQVNDQFELLWLFDGEVRWLRSLE
jgi:hypothetical protein